MGAKTVPASCKQQLVGLPHYRLPFILCKVAALSVSLGIAMEVQPGSQQRLKVLTRQSRYSVSPLLLRRWERKC